MEKKNLLWNEKMNNLMTRRKQNIVPPNPVTGNYALHFKKIKIGATVLDVGCGRMDIKKALSATHPNTTYSGLDPFPVDATVIGGKIEEFDAAPRSYDTVLLFAVLDGVENIELALSRLNAIANENIGVLTGLGIEPDKYHTFKITESLLIAGLPDFHVRYKEELLPKVFLFDFWRN